MNSVTRPMDTVDWFVEKKEIRNDFMNFKARVLCFHGDCVIKSIWFNKLKDNAHQFRTKSFGYSDFSLDFFFFRFRRFNNVAFVIRMNNGHSVKEGGCEKKCLCDELLWR